MKRNKLSLIIAALLAVTVIFTSCGKKEPATAPEVTTDADGHYAVSDVGIVVPAAYGSSLDDDTLSYKSAAALSVDGVNISAIELRYYYSVVYDRWISTLDNYSDYGVSNTYDKSVSPEMQQNKTKDDDGNEITWADYFLQRAIDQAVSVETLYNAAMEAGFTPDDDFWTNIDDTIKTYTDAADNNNVDMDTFLQYVFGDGYTEAVFRKQLIKEQVANDFAAQKQAEFYDSFTADEIKAEYNKNPDDYNYASIRVIAYYFTDDETRVVANHKAAATYSQWESGDKTEESFADMAESYSEDTVSKSDGGLISKLHRTDSYAEELIEWCFDSSRKKGDTTVVESKDSFLVVYYREKGTQYDDGMESAVRTVLATQKADEYAKSLTGGCELKTSAYWTEYVKNKFCEEFTSESN